MDLNNACEKAEEFGIRDQLPACNVSEHASCNRSWGEWSECHCSSEKPFRTRYRMAPPRLCHAPVFQLDESAFCETDCQETFGIVDNQSKFYSSSSSGKVVKCYEIQSN
ncbi:Oidioi.mRNA.OKI2018_I69.XSR.g16634.t1.cds [Oikopleura dioica]|uniref:Oidioi.mRNA.OKI2018_I69.XSR.g16634.t1.cds n=1 Tax=Oikopleura dioica TaxID=34765 RepID=A0ABN7SP05_OIKDI|nr:Oidioi.mRNA.OKI2018_I69.XSR.g16634.t1.cds [Oikopleura dioica]